MAAQTRAGLAGISIWVTPRSDRASTTALMGRMPTIARAHRGKVALLLICTILPYSVSIANNMLNIGPRDFPFTSATLLVIATTAALEVL